MFRKFKVTFGILAACGLAVGCGGTSGETTVPAKPSGEKGPIAGLKPAASIFDGKAAEAAKDAADKAKELLTKGKEELLKTLGVGDMKMFEDKIKGLSGDAQKDATTKFDAVKAMIADFMKGDKLEGWKEKLEPLVASLKKSVGL
jgi:hypothetical protein